MKILFTGGGSGGHFYPIIAVMEAIERIVADRKLIPPSFYYTGPEQYDKNALREHDVTFVYIPAGKIRRYKSIKNITDIIKTIVGIIKAVISLFFIYPDVIFSKGGYASFPTLYAGRLLRIPIVIHESDVVPGKVTLWASSFAQKIGISYAEAGQYFPKEKTALTGTPIRHELLKISSEGANELFHLEEGIPTVLILGGSQGATRINETVLDALPKLLANFQVIHQTGVKNFDEVKKTSNAILMNSEFKGRYHPEAFLSPLSLRLAAGISKVVVTRAGAGALSEIATWHVPAIVIPIPESISHDQTKNAFTYARSGAGVVLEETNFTPNILIGEITRIVNEPDRHKRMSDSAKAFARTNASELLATEILAIALSHES